MTTGPIFQKMLIFVLPMMMTNLLQKLYNVADMIMVGQFSSVEGTVGAIGCTSAFITLIRNFMIGLSVGTSVIVSQSIGAGDREATRRGVHSSLVMGVLIGVGSMIIGQVLCRPVLTLMGTGPEFMEMAVTYTRIRFVGLPFTAVLNCSLGIMRAQGDSTRPLFILSMSGILNVALNAVFVILLGMDVDGVAYATLISVVASTVVAVACLVRDRGVCHVSFKDLRIHPATLRSVLAVGVPSGLQGMLFNISNMTIQSAINSLGAEFVSAASIETNLYGFVFIAGEATSSAAMTFAGQNLGAKKYNRIMPSLFNSYLIVLMIGGSLAALMFTFLDPLAGLYMNEATSNREVVLSAIRLIASFRMLFIPLCGLMDCGALMLRGLGRSTLSMVISLIGACGLRIVWVYTAFAVVPEPWVLFLSYPLSWVLTGVAQFVCVWATTRKLKREAPSDEACAPA